MKKVVEIYNDEPRCGTFLIAEGFGRRHNKVLELIRKHEEQFLDAESFTPRRAKLLERKVKTAGRPVIEFLLNKEQTTFLGMLFRTSADPEDPVLKFKAKLAKDFILQEKIINAIYAGRITKEWIENRAAGKIARREETDTIKDFVEYATMQGSKNAQLYYSNLSRAVNSNMFNFSGKFRNVREVLTANQLIDVKFADKVVSRALIEGMAQSLPYREIYSLVRDRLVSLADMYGKSDVISEQLFIEEEAQ